MRFATILPVLALAASTAATRVFIGSFGGKIITADIDNEGRITEVASTSDAGPQPGWQEISPVNSSLLYTAENNDPVSLLSSFEIKPDGSLVKVSSQESLKEPVSIAISPDGKTILTASYIGGGISAYSSDLEGNLTLRGHREFPLYKPGKVTERQEASHPHQVILDPTGQFATVPDLGNDVIHIFMLVGDEFPAILCPAVLLPPGTGPRHGAFFPTTGKARFYYLVGELAHTVTVYSVRYEPKNLVLEELQTVPAIPEASGSKSLTGEIAISPDGKFVYVSNRFDTMFPETGTSAITLYSRKENGELKEEGFFDSGVVTPRHITIDSTGQWFVASGQDSGDVKVYRWDAATGMVRDAVGTLSVPGGAVSVTWAREPE